MTIYLTKEQLYAVEQFVSGRDVFVSLPTGSGKSVCYACLPLVFDTLRQAGHSIVVVIAPLSALMQDQVASFTERGLKCAALNEHLAHKRGVAGPKKWRPEVIISKCFLAHKPPFLGSTEP